eukprot:4009325-Amphidinium_carterae.1
MCVLLQNDYRKNVTLVSVVSVVDGDLLTLLFQKTLLDVRVQQQVWPCRKSGLERNYNTVAPAFTPGRVQG